jgi:hypothetical protein
MLFRSASESCIFVSDRYIFTPLRRAVRYGVNCKHGLNLAWTKSYMLICALYQLSGGQCWTDRTFWVFQFLIFVKVYEASQRLVPEISIVPLKSPVTARYLRLYPTGCISSRCCLAVEVFGCDPGMACNLPPSPPDKSCVNENCYAWNYDWLIHLEEGWVGI